MSDNLGAAPYTPPPSPSAWERIKAWWRRPSNEVAGYSRAVEQAIGRPLAARRVPIPASDDKVDMPWSIARAAGRTAALAGRRYEPPPPKNGGPSHPPTPVFE